MEPVDVVNAFIEAIGRKDMEATKALVADDCYYDNVPVGDMRGWEKMLDVLGPMFKSTEPVEFEVLRQTASGNCPTGQGRRLIPVDRSIQSPPPKRACARSEPA